MGTREIRAAPRLMAISAELTGDLVNLAQNGSRLLIDESRVAGKTDDAGPVGA